MSSASGTIGSTGEVGEDFGERSDHNIIVGCIIARYAEDLGKLVSCSSRSYGIFAYLV